MGIRRGVDPTTEGGGELRHGPGQRAAKGNACQPNGGDRIAEEYTTGGEGEPLDLGGHLRLHRVLKPLRSVTENPSAGFRSHEGYGG